MGNAEPFPTIDDPTFAIEKPAALGIIYCCDCDHWGWGPYGRNTPFAPCLLSTTVGFDKPVITTDQTTCSKAKKR